MFHKIGKVFLIKPKALKEEELSFYRELSFENFLFFREHFSDDFREYLARLSGALKSLRLLAVDQEGGRVCRIEGDFEAPFEISEMAKSLGEIVAVNWSEKIAKTLRSLGLNLNLAPVVDLGDEREEPYLRLRTFSSDPKVVTKLAKIFITTHKKWNIFTTLKHFPGLGRVRIDPHLELPEKEIPSEEDLYPFKTLCALTDFIMTTHIVIKSWDAKPVTFSEIAIKYLRKALEFRGAIMTDDLNMGALRAYELPERIIYALVSGHNLLIYCGDLEDLIEALELIKPELQKSSVLKERLSESLTILERYSRLIPR